MDIICNSCIQCKEHIIECFEVFEKIWNNLKELIELRKHIYIYCLNKYSLEVMNDLEEILEELKNKDEIIIVNYIELLFNEELYKRSINDFNKYNNKYLFLGILNCEHWKIIYLNKILKTLIFNFKNPKYNVRNRIIETQCNKNILISKELINQYYKFANEFLISKEELEYCHNIYNLYHKDNHRSCIKNKYEIEIVIEK